MNEPSVIQIGRWFLVIGLDWHHHEESHGEGRGYTRICYGAFLGRGAAEELRQAIVDVGTGKLVQKDLTLGTVDA